MDANCAVRLPALLFGVVCSCLNVPAAAQECGPAVAGAAATNGDLPPTKPSADPQSSPAPDSVGSRPSRGSLVVAPIPISSPALGTGVIPVLGYIFPLSERDKESPPSTVGAAGLFTNNGSRAFALAGEFYFKENRYKATAAYARGNLDYDIYTSGVLGGPPRKLPLDQTGRAFLGEFLRRLWWDVFVGPRFLDGSSVITLGESSAGATPVPPDLGLHSTVRAIGFRLQRDTRPNHFYPTSGTLTDFTADFFLQPIGSKYSFQAYQLTFNKYGSLTKNQVLAFGSYFCATGGQPPFYGNCIYGARNQLRGYTAGRYFDRYMLTSQLEYRLALPLRLGLVVFGGLGGVKPGNDQLLIRNAYFLPGAGVGLRFALSKKYQVNLRADIGYGKDGHTFGLGLGEAF